MAREEKEGGRNRSEVEEEDVGEKSEHRVQKSDLDGGEYTDAEGNVRQRTKRDMEGNQEE